MKYQFHNAYYYVFSYFSVKRNLRTMKKLFLIFALGTLVSSCGSGPDVCDCVNNAMSIMDSSSYDADLQKECVEYANGLNEEDKAERALNAYECMISGSGPDVCDCVNNAMSIMDPSSYDADLQKECEEYANGLNDEDKAERALNGLKCMTN